MFFRNRSIIAIFIVLSIFFIAACGSADSGSTPSSKSENSGEASQQDNNHSKTDAKEDIRVIQHEMGETPVEGTPERVVVLEFSFVDALAAIGLSPVGVADDNETSRIIEPIAKQIEGYTSVGTRKQPSLEIIASLKPDLIIADFNRHKEIYSQLQEIAPTIVLNSLRATYSENLESFEVIAEAIDKKEEAQKRLNEHKDKIKAMKNQVPSGEERTVLTAVVTKDIFNAHASKSYTGEVLELLGLMNAIQQEDPYAKLNLEQLVEINPDILFMMTAGEKTLIDEWQNNPLYQNLKAVKNGAVYDVDRNLWSRFRGLIAGEMIAEDAIGFLYSK